MMTDQPTPTSSLEEARAAARAEVIREIDSWLDDGIAYREASGDDAVISAFKTLKLFIARLRVLSQGGEGKA